MDNKLRTALLNRDFEMAQSLISEWGKRVVLEIGTASGELERRRLFDEARCFAEENIYLARVIRAHIAAELQANSASFLYRDADLEQPRWQLRA